MKRKSGPQLKTEPLPNIYLAVSREHINFKMTYFEHHSKVTVLFLKRRKGEMALLTVQKY